MMLTTLIIMSLQLLVSNELKDEKIEGFINVSCSIIAVMT